MNLLEDTLGGTLTTDGASPVVPKARVKSDGENLMDFLAKSRRELEELGSKFLNDEEVKAYIREMREGA